MGAVETRSASSRWPWRWFSRSNRRVIDRGRSSGLMPVVPLATLQPGCSARGCDHERPGWPILGWCHPFSPTARLVELRAFHRHRRRTRDVAMCGSLAGRISVPRLATYRHHGWWFRFRYRKSKHCHGCICFSERARTFSALPARVVFSDSVVHRTCGLQSRSLRLQGFLLATLVDIRSSKAPHCLIRRWNRRQSITLWSRAF